jgi:predicted nucleic acid-binding protein
MTGRLLDTTVVIDLARGSTDAARFVDVVVASGIPLFVSVISAMELVVGRRDKFEVEQAQRLVSSFTLLYLTPVESRQAYDPVLSYSKSHGLAIPDALIAATALVQGLELASDNERHFAMIPNLEIERPY